MKTLKFSLEFITDNLHKDLHLTEIASTAGLSPFHFARLFRNATGQTPHQYLREQRLRRARELLRSSCLPVSQIGTEVGLPNHAHFARTFREREGLTPTAWPCLNNIETWRSFRKRHWSSRPLCDRFKCLLPASSYLPRPPGSHRATSSRRCKFPAILRLGPVGLHYAVNTDTIASHGYRIECKNSHSSNEHP
jgi:AraC-like DNA-binding protein